MKKLLGSKSGLGFLAAFLAVCSFVATSRAERYVIAYLPFGGGWSSRIFLTNPKDETVQVEIRFFSQDGEPTGIGDEPDTKQLSVEPGAVATVSLEDHSPESTPKILWAVAQTSNPLHISSSFDSSVPVESSTEIEEVDAAMGPPITPPGRGLRPPTPPGKPEETGGGKPPGRPPVTVPGTTASVDAFVTNITGAVALPSGDSFLVPINIAEAKGLNAGLTLGNPNDVPANVSLTLTDSTGLQKVVRVVQVLPKNQLAGLVNDPSLFEAELSTSDSFDGTVAVCSDVPIGVLALGFAGKLAYTLPISTDYQCPGTAGL